MDPATADSLGEDSVGYLKGHHRVDAFARRGEHLVELLGLCLGFRVLSFVVSLCHLGFGFCGFLGLSLWFLWFGFCGFPLPFLGLR